MGDKLRFGTTSLDKQATAQDPQINQDLLRDLDALAQNAAQALDCDYVFMHVKVGECLHSLGAHPNLGTEMASRTHRAADLVCDHTVRNAAMLVREDVRVSPEFASLPCVRTGAVVAYLGVPIQLAGPGAVGAVCSISTEPRAWTAMEVKYMQQVAQTVELRILNTMKDVEAMRFARDLSELDQIVASLSAKTLSPISVYKTDGDLVFGNAALIERVSYETIAAFWRTHGRQAMCPLPISDQITPPHEATVVHIQSETPHGQSVKVRVTCTLSPAGLVVCIWDAMTTSMM